MHTARPRILLALAVASMAMLADGYAQAAPYKDNLAACVMGRRSCDRSALRADDAEYLESDRTARTRDPEMARRIAEARLQKPIRIVVSERRLDHMHARTIAFERYRSIVRAEQHGWIPGANRPYEQPVEGWAIPPRHRQRDRPPSGILGYDAPSGPGPGEGYPAEDGYRGASFLD